MPIIPCPDCKAEVSSFAECCPKCAYPLRNGHASGIPKLAVILLAIFVFASVSIYGIYSFKSAISPNETKAGRSEAIIKPSDDIPAESRTMAPTKIEQNSINKPLGKYRQVISDSTKYSLQYYQFNEDNTGHMFAFGATIFTFTWSHNNSHVTCVCPDETITFIKVGRDDLEFVGLPLGLNLYSRIPK